MGEIFAINPGPLISFARMDALFILDQLPFSFVIPDEVKQELTSGPQDPLSIGIPTYINVNSLSTPHRSDLFDNLDSGEAAVIQLALESGISTACLDERKARRIATRFGLRALGSLGLLGRAKTLGIITTIAPLVRKALQNGVHYDQKLVEDFLLNFGEDWTLR